MHVALIVDEERLARERPMLDRLSAGLAARKVRVTAVVPDRAVPAADGPGGPLTAAACLTTRMQVPPWIRRLRARRLARAFAGGAPDVLHAVGDQAWPLALDLAKVVERPVTIDVWSAEQVAHLPPARTAAGVAGYIATTEPIAEALRQQVEPELVTVVPVGVPLPESPKPTRGAEEQSPAVAIIGSGRDREGYGAVLQALSRLARELPTLQACLELREPHGHEIWREARRLNLLGHLSSVEDASLHGPLLAGCDVLAVAEKLGQSRSLLLEAMAMGMPVVAAADPFLDMLVADRTAILVDRPDPDVWADHLRRLLTDPDRAGRLGAGARAWVEEHHSTQRQVEELQRAFEQILSGGAHAFAAGV